MTLHASGFWSFTLGFFLLMQANQTPIPAEPAQIVPDFSNQTLVAAPLDDTSQTVSVNVFESADCEECHTFATHTLVPLWRLYQHNPHLDFKIYFIPNGAESALGQDVAKSLICVEDQGQFWPFYEALHAQEKLLNMQEIETLMTEKELKLDLEKFKTCLSDNKTEATLKKHVELAQRKQIEIYPSTLIGNVQFIHSQPLENLMRVIDEKTMEMNQIQIK